MAYLNLLFATAPRPLVFTFSTANVPALVVTFRTRPAPLTFAFSTGKAPALLFAFRTSPAAMVFSFSTVPILPPFAYSVNDATRIVIATIPAYTGTAKVNVFRVSDGASVSASVAPDGLTGKVTFLADTTDEVYRVIVEVVAANTVRTADNYAVVLINARAAFREENRLVATGGEKAEGLLVPTARWMQLLSRMAGVEALVAAEKLPEALALIGSLRKLETYDHEHLGGVW